MTVDDRPGRAAGVRAHWAGIVDEAHDRISAKLDARKMDHLATVLERFETELGPRLVPFLAEHLDNPNLPDSVRDLLGAIVGPEHFTESLLIGIAVGAVIAPVLGAITAPTGQDIANEVWSHNPVVPLTPDLLAAAVIKGVLSEAQAAGIALHSGINSTAFHTMTMTAGQSIGTAEALLLLRRKQIDRTEFERIIRYSNVRNDFIDDILKLTYAPPPAGEVISGSLKGHLPPAEAQQKLGEAGIDPANFQWMHDTAGRPPGIEQMLHLWNRRKVVESDIDAAVRQSDINDHYLAAVKELRWYVPPVRSIMPMLRSGAIDDARATELFTEQGVRPEDIPGYLKEAHHTKGGTAKELTGSQVVRMYSDRFMDRGTASSRLALAGYPADEITLLLDFADHARTEKLTNALIAKVGTLYVAHKLTKSEASTALNADAVPAAQQADLFHVWDLERTAAVHKPTTAQVVGAYRRTEITAADCKARLLALGVQPGDLGIIVADGWPPTKEAEAKAAALAVVNA